MATITVAKIRARADQKADMVGSNFVTFPEQLAMINEAYFSFYDLIVSRFEDYNLGTPTSFSLASGVSSYPLPSDFYKLAGVDRQTGTNKFYPLRNYPWRSRNRFQASFSQFGLHPRIGYRLIGPNLTFVPDDQAQGDYRLWYIPLPTELVLESDTFERYNGFEELVVIDTAIKMVAKEESDISYLMTERQRIEARIQEMLLDRDINDGERIEEVDRGSYGDESYNYD